MVRNRPARRTEVIDGNAQHSAPANVYPFVSKGDMPAHPVYGFDFGLPFCTAMIRPLIDRYGPVAMTFLVTSSALLR